MIDGRALAVGRGIIETILMTDSGLEVLSGLDRNVTVIE